MAKRVKTEYPFIIYLKSTSKSRKPVRVFYILYRKPNKNGKLVQIEEKARENRHH